MAALDEDNLREPGGGGVQLDADDVAIKLEQENETQGLIAAEKAVEPKSVDDIGPSWDGEFLTDVSAAVPTFAREGSLTTPPQQTSRTDGDERCSETGEGGVGRRRGEEVRGHGGGNRVSNRMAFAITSLSRKGGPSTGKTRTFDAN